MLIYTHKIISDHIYNNLKLNLNVELNKNLLRFGSMKPDMAPILGKIRHYKEYSFEFVLDEITNLMQYDINSKSKFINEFSINLGVVSHFLSDFFCHPHHNREYYHDKFLEHMQYENRLHKEFLKFNGIDKVKIPNIESATKENIKTLIEELHYEYTNKSTDFKNDITHSINVSSAIGIIIFKQLNSSLLSSAIS